MSTRNDERLEQTVTRARVPAPAVAPVQVAAPHPAAVLSRALASGAGMRPADVLSLQRTLGNRAVQRMLAGGPRVQAKLSVNVPGDPYEVEADAVARQVVSAINQPAPAAGTAGAGVQRVEEDEDKLLTKPLLQRDPLPEDEEKLLAKPDLMREGESAPAPVASHVESQIESARGGGQAMDPGIRGAMESAFSADFSGVRVHTGAESDSLNRAVQARAFTTGQDIFFSGGEYDPASSGGQELLAHELTHVVQQNGPAVARKDQE
ncbi:MAG: hypothetical protein JWM27_977 [Gemmatimonadetes bacterium]|nr:hypothetical protein [Gemmatimonadota bacterium]